MERVPYSKYTKELRLEAVRIVTEGGLSVGEASMRLSLPQIYPGELAAGLQSWEAGADRQKPPTVDRCGDRAGEGEAGTGPGSDGAGHLKKSGRVLCQGVAARHAVMEQMRREYPLKTLCRVLDVSASGVYASRSRGPSRRTQEEPRLEIEIRAAHQRTRQTYGPERLQRDLAAHGVRVGVHRIKRIRRKMGLRCKQRRKFKVTTNSRHSLPVAENLLEQRFEAEAPSQAWLSDITYIPTDEGWLYLVGHKDLCTRKIVGYAMGARMTQNLVMESLLRVVETTKPPKGLLHHSDKGSQYCSQEYRRMLEGPRNESLHERNWELLRQRPHGEFLGNAEDRVDLSSPIRYPTASHSGDYRVH